MKKYFFLCFLSCCILFSFSGCKKDNSLDEFEDIYPIVGLYNVDVITGPSVTRNQTLTISRISSTKVNISTSWAGGVSFSSVIATVSKEIYVPKKKKDKTRKIKYVINIDKQEVENLTYVVGTGLVYEGDIQIDYTETDSNQNNWGSKIIGSKN